MSTLSGALVANTGSKSLCVGVKKGWQNSLRNGGGKN